MNLYLKYRPQTIDELDLDSVRKSFNDILVGNKTSHAYLFTGPRGSGKTSSARILARIVNCENNQEKLAEPCNQCDNCRAILDGSAVDVVEIDAASNRGIDDIRELKEKIRLAPSHLSHKVYIIDEVHMLTTEAFNALLKTLEEPPSHAMFILCTTEVHKLPETIVSRCVRVQFTKATSAELARSISRVIRGEKVKVTPEAISYIADHVDGSFRDGVKVLDQLLATGEEVTKDLVKQAMGGIVGYTSLPFVEAMLAHDATLSLQLFHQAVSAGSDLIYFLTSAMKTLRDGLLAPYGIGESVLKVPVFATELITKMDIVARGIGTAVMPELLVEVMIVEWCGESANQRTSTPAKQQVSESVDQNVSVSENVVQNVAPITKVEGTELRSMWRQMMSTMDKANYSLEALLSKAWPARVEGGELVIQVSHDFHKTQLETARFRNQIDGMVVAAFGQPLVVRFEVGRENLPGEVESANISELEQIFIN